VHVNLKQAVLPDGKRTMRVIRTPAVERSKPQHLSAKEGRRRALAATGDQPGPVTTDGF
jgi:hypothetical protein